MKLMADSDVSTPKGAIRYCCPFPGCNRSFRDFWRLKVHYRAQPGARGSGVERGHGQELPHCPLCLARLDDVKYHKCSAGPAAQAGMGKKGANAFQQAAASHQAAVPAGMVSSSAVSTMTAVRPTVTWPQHLSVSTQGPTMPQQQHQGYANGTVGAMGHNGQMVSAMPQAQHQQQGLQQQQQQQAAQQVAMQQQHQQLQLPAKQLWVQTGAASGSNSAGTTISAHVTASFQPQQHQQQYQQQHQQQQQYHQQHQQQQAWQGQHLQYAQSNGMPQQQQAWQGQQQQQQVQLQVSAGISTQHYAPAASAALQQQQQQQPPLAPQLLMPALGQMHQQQQQQQQQLDQHQLSPVITLPSNHPINNTGGQLYRPSPRLSGDGCLSSLLLPRLSADGGGGTLCGLGSSSSQWAPVAAAAMAAVAQQHGQPGTPAAGAQALLPGAVTAFRQTSQPGSAMTFTNQQQQLQQQQQAIWPQQQQQQGVASYGAYRGAAGKGSNNSGSSSSGEWMSGPQAAVTPSGALSGLIQGFAAELQARSYLQGATAEPQHNPMQQQLQQQQQGQELDHMAAAAQGSNGYQSYAPSMLPLSQAWLQQPNTAAAAADTACAAADSTQMLPAAALTAAITATAAAAAAAVTPAGPGDTQGLVTLPDYAQKIAEDFKAALTSLRSSMEHRDSPAQPGGVQAEGHQTLARYVSSSGSNSPTNSSQDGKAPLPGSCTSMSLAADQQQQQQDCADASPDARAVGAISGGGHKRPAGDPPPPAAAAAADAADAEQQPAKKQKLSPTQSASAQLPPLGAAGKSGSNAGSPTKPQAGFGPAATPPKAPAPAGVAAFANGPFAAASGGLATVLSQEGGGSSPASAAGLTRSCSVWSSTPPPPEAPAALLELAAQMERDTGALQLPAMAPLPETLPDAATECAAMSAMEGATTTAWQPGQGEEGQDPGPGAAAAQLQLLALPAAAAGGADDHSGSQKHRALVATLLKKATDDARACGLDDPSPLVSQLMMILDEHVAALSQLGSPGTELGVASAGGVSVELPNAPSVGQVPDAAAGAEQYAHSGAVAAAVPEPVPASAAAARMHT